MRCDPFHVHLGLQGHNKSSEMLAGVVTCRGIKQTLILRDGVGMGITETDNCMTARRWPAPA
jgi:hypothetical protein